MCKYIMFACFTTLLLVATAGASPQSNTETKTSHVQEAQQTATTETTEPALSQGHLVRPTWLQTWLDRYSRPANNTGKNTKGRPVSRDRYPRLRPIYRLAQSPALSAKAEETTAISVSGSESKPDPAAQPATEQEVAALRARIAELEAKAEPKADSKAEPAPKPATEEELEALRARIAELEKQLGDVIASTPKAAPNQQEKVPNGAAQVDLLTPFADHDWTWLNGATRQHDYPLDTKYFSGEFRADTFYGVDFNQPKDHSMGGSSEVFRSGEVQLEDLSFGGDFHAGNMRGRVLFLFGMFSATTPRNDASAAVGQWDVRSAYRYVSEAYGGYHFNFQHGVNVDAGIFVSYVCLFSYHNFDNWAYQPSYVSSNTPWFFNGVRVQWFPTQHLKIEPWFINGWQSYNKFNGHPGIGGQIRWAPLPWLNIIGNQYAVGNDNVGLPNRGRYHTDDSIEVKYYDNPRVGNGINRMAFTFTGDVGCETGDGVTCHGGKGPYDPTTGKGGPAQSFLGYMLYNRWWWHHDLFAVTLGGGQINNKGRYLALVLPVNGADAISGTPYFPAYPGAPYHAYDGTATFDWMPSQFVTFRWEAGYRHVREPYWSGRQGITPPGGNNGAPGFFACASGASSGTADLAAAQAACGGANNVWFPDLRRGQATFSMMIMVKL
jgi:BMFP domain-containing protein YqiC